MSIVPATVEALDGLVADLRGAGSPIEASLRPGVDPDRIAQAQRALGFPLPPELETLYHWHDGAEPAGPDLFPGGEFRPLDEVVEAYLRMADYCDFASGVPTDRFWVPGVLPVFAVEDLAVSWVALCDETVAEATPMGVRVLEDPTLGDLADSVTDAVRRVRQRLRNGVYAVGASGAIVNGPSPVVPGPSRDF
ncbi:SMI1/KNR4 family protein [Agromyces arachidis]|uniref:SMI1/KNR4 family protein n=1 Tax=Agromyces arachidis TaxID=766966 RepID=UPI004056491B